MQRGILSDPKKKVFEFGEIEAKVLAPSSMNVNTFELAEWLHQ